MTYMSPLLHSKLYGTSSVNGHGTELEYRNEKTYRDLQKKAKDVKPNKAKAKMVKEGMLGNPITAVKDNFKDCKNFVKAVTTGQIGDNNLGRINDLGLKAGALLIATYLATHARTKTEAIMKFVGGGAFIASMSLWPKLFINIPARLVHGFRIDRKYISAQGDKKDFGLDNQFMVWDAYPEEQLAKDAKRSGIDYNSKNGKEKIQRKIQKTILQNRTLWMATAGFATPLMTAMACNRIEPKIQDSVIKHEFKKAKAILDNGFEDYIQKAEPMVRHSDEIESLLKDYANTKLDDSFFDKLTKILNPADFADVYKDIDDFKPLEEFSNSDLAEQLKNIYNSKQITTIDTNDLEKLLRATKKNAFFVETPLSEEEIKEILKKVKNNLTIENIENTLQDYKVSSNDIEKVKTLAKTSNDKFFDFVKKYNDGPVAQMRGRLKAYLDVLNPVVGSKSESVFTQEFLKYMKNLISKFHIKSRDMTKIKNTVLDDDVINILSNSLVRKLQNVEYGSDKYKAVLKEFLTADFTDEVKEAIKTLADEKNISAIFSGEALDGISIKDLNKATVGYAGDQKGLVDLLQGFIKAKQIDIDAIKSQILICANFEQRLANGSLVFKNKDNIQTARKLLYDGTFATSVNGAYAANSKDFEKIIETVYNVKNFKVEQEFMPNIEKTLSELKQIAKRRSHINNSAEDYLKCSSLVKLVKEKVTSLCNDRTWMRTFGTMSILVALTTLLVQPLFGKIDKDFPVKKKNGGAK